MGGARMRGMHGVRQGGACATTCMRHACGVSWPACRARTAAVSAAGAERPTLRPPRLAPPPHLQAMFMMGWRITRLHEEGRLTHEQASLAKVGLHGLHGSRGGVDAHLRAAPPAAVCAARRARGPARPRAVPPAPSPCDVRAPTSCAHAGVEHAARPRVRCAGARAPGERLGAPCAAVGRTTRACGG